MCRIVFFETVCGSFFPMHRVLRWEYDTNDKVNVKIDVQTTDDGWETVYRDEWDRARKAAEGS